MDQKDYWNGVSEKKEFTTPFQTDVFSRYVEKDKFIVDVGCGYGRTLNELRRQGYSRLLGFDFSPEMIKRGRRQFPELDLRVGEGDRIALPDNSVDAVVLFAVLTCLVKDEDQKRLISEIYRILKPSGVVYINDFLLNSDERNIARYARYREQLGVYGAFELPEGATLRHHSEEWIQELTQNFHRKEYERLTFATMNGHTSNGFYFIGEK